MAEGLSFPALSLGSHPGFRSLFDPQGAPGGAPGSTQGSSSIPGLSDLGGLFDILDLGGGTSVPQNSVPPGGFALAPDGTYQFSRFAANASLDLSVSQSQIEISQGEEGTSVLASLSELNLSISVSAEFEEALIQTGRSRGGNVADDLQSASQAALDRFAARSVRASIQVNLSFSQSSLSFGNTGEGLKAANPFGSDANLAGFLSLIESFFGDDERFEKFIQSLEEFLSGSSGGSETSAQAAAETAPQSAPAEGTTTTIQSQSVSVSIDISFESTEVTVTQEGSQGQASDPIVFDLDGDGIELTSAAAGVSFDLDADGVAEQTATATGGDGFLALDRNGNGLIDNGSELFGDQNGAANGFAELAKFDSNRDGVIDRNDSVFDQLRVFIDRNLDGISQNGELIGLLDAGIASIDLRAADVSERATGGNTIAQRSFFTRTDGSRGQSVDALLNRLA